MDMFASAVLFTAGLLGGIVSTIAGGGSLMTYPVLVFMGLTPIVASASNSVALSFSSFAAVLWDRDLHPPFDRRVLALLALCFAGTMAGGVLLLWLGAAQFRNILPLLLGAATLVFAIAPRIGPAARHAGAHPFTNGWIAAFGLSSVYGGFFGSGLGVIILAMLRFAGEDDYIKANALKNLMGFVVSLALIGFFIFTPLVSWPETIAMLLGNIAGGIAGTRLIRVLPAQGVRNFILASGVVMTVYFGWKIWWLG